MKRLTVWTLVAVILAFSPTINLRMPPFNLSASAVFAAERVDNVTQRNEMHSCPVGTFVTGLHNDRNLLICSDKFRSYSASDEIVSHGHGRRGWHPEGAEAVESCPDGMAVTGIHAERRLLACAPLARIRGVFLDKNTQRQGMHACPRGTVLIGHHVGFGASANRLLCGTSEYFTTEQRNGMLSCLIGKFVTGIHVARNRLMCSAAFGEYTQSTERVDSSTMRVWGPSRTVAALKGWR